MKYFAYGSNMSLVRLRQRVPSAAALGCYSIQGYDLRFHKIGQDGSAKCDAYFTQELGDLLYGVLFEIATAEKPFLDKVEGLGHGYTEKTIWVSSESGRCYEATTYIARHINPALKPFSWYVNHVLLGAQESSLPYDYIKKKIITVDFIEDKNKVRDAEQRAIHGEHPW